MHSYTSSGRLNSAQKTFRNQVATRIPLSFSRGMLISHLSAPILKVTSFLMMNLTLSILRKRPRRKHLIFALSLSLIPTLIASMSKALRSERFIPLGLTLLFCQYFQSRRRESRGSLQGARRIFRRKSCGLTRSRLLARSPLPSNAINLALDAI